MPWATRTAGGDKAAGPDLTGFGTHAWVLGVLDDPDAAHRFGRTPFKGRMPSMTRPPEDPGAAKMWTPLLPADQESIAAFLEAEAGGRGGRGMPGETLVRRRCTGCHRLDGKTDDDDSLAPELRGWASAGWIEAADRRPRQRQGVPRGREGGGARGAHARLRGGYARGGPQDPRGLAGGAAALKRAASRPSGRCRRVRNLPVPGRFRL